MAITPGILPRDVVIVPILLTINVRPRPGQSVDAAKLAALAFVRRAVESAAPRDMGPDIGTISLFNPVTTPTPEPEPMVTIPSDGATKALDVVTQYADSTGEPISEVMPLDAQIGDLVVDLHHLCDREGIKWRDVLSLAAGQYRDEVRAEGKARRPGDAPAEDGPGPGA